MNKKVKQFKYFMIILACIAIFVTILPNALDPNETLAGNISVAVLVQLVLVCCFLSLISL